MWKIVHVAFDEKNVDMIHLNASFVWGCYSLFGIYDKQCNLQLFELEINTSDMFYYLLSHERPNEKNTQNINMYCTIKRHKYAIQNPCSHLLLFNTVLYRFHRKLSSSKNRKSVWSNILYTGTSNIEWFMEIENVIKYRKRPVPSVNSIELNEYYLCA